MAEQYVFLFNQTRCIGCNTCVVACKDWKEIEPGKVSLRRHEEIVVKTAAAPGFKIYRMLYACYHCDSPRCVIACGLGSIKKDKETGIVYLDQSVCQGLRSCETRSGCPYGNISHADKRSAQDRMRPGMKVSRPGFKCDMCRDRLQEGELPICVAACINRALDFGTKDYIKAKYPAATQQNVVGFEDKGTSPNWFFIRESL